MQPLMPPRGLRCGRGSHEVDPDRLALVRTGDPGGCGSGYLIGPQLVLTALHVVRPEGRWAGRVEVRVGHPRYGAGPVDRRAQVCWPDPQRDAPPADALDVALLWLDEPVDTGEAPVRWGRPGGIVPVSFEGAGFPAFAADAGNPAHFEYLRGELPVVSTSSSGWVLNCPVWPASGRGKERPWEGASGSAIFCHGRLVGVVAEDNQTMGYRRLHAVPVHEALTLPGFADLLIKRGHPGTTTTLEEVTADGVGSRARLSPHIRTHAEELARLRGKGSYLIQKNLPFVSPSDGSDPKPLLRKLTKLTDSAAEQESKRGVLLIGPAGAGKTRTCFEIAKAALEQREPWQVLHVAGSPEVSTDDVMAVVREQAGRQRVLLIFDYLDSYEALNIKALGEALQTEDPDGRVACVASVRPGMLGMLRKNGVRLLLDEVPLRSDRDHTEKVIRQIFVKVAPKMLETWGARRLLQVCGQRPIIALLIARELEARLKPGVSELNLLPPRPEDLLIWLQQRTEQDFGEPAKETQLLASAVAAASCEQDQDAVEAAVRGFLALWPDPTFRDGPEGVVGRLLHLGWLVDSGQGIDSVHDVVTDEFLRMAAVDPDGDTVRAEVLKALLSAFLAGARTFGVASRHLRRWSADLVDTHRRTLERACANWLADNTDQLAALVAGEPQAGRSIMLAMLSGPPWRKAVDDSWDRLVGPWLEETEERDPGKAATALDSAVRNSVGGVSEHLVDACLAWVERQRTTREVSPLLRLLIEADGVSAPDRDKVAAHTLGWFEEQRTLSRGGARLFAGLLRCKDLGADRAVEVIDVSLKWMGQSKRNPDAGLVLRPLLLRKDLDEPRQTRTVDRALAWLGAEPPPSAAALVLAAALRSENLRDGQAARVTRSAYAWLKAHGGHIDASLVLEPLLAQCRREATEARVVLNHAFGWLDRHVPVRRSSYVLAEVLLRKDLGAKRAAAAIAAAQRWLVENGLIDDAKFLFSSLLSRSDIDRETMRKLTDDAVTWLSRHGLDNGGTYVVSALLRPDAVAGHVDEAARTALTLLGDTYNPALTRSTLADVLKSGVGPGPRRDAVDRALDWLEETEPEFETTYVLGPLLEHRRFLEGRTSRVVRLALGWLDDYGTRLEASFVLEPLLALPGVTDDEAEAIEEKAQEWLADHLPSEDARFILRRLLQRPELALDWPESVETLAFTWLGDHGDHPYASYVIDPLLRWSDAARPEDAVHLGLSWLEKNPTAEGVSYVVLALAARRDLDLDQYAWCIDRLLELLDAGPEHAYKLLKEVWFRSDLDPARAARLSEHVLGVLEDEEIPPDRGLLIGLLCLALGPEHQCRAVRLAFHWLEGPAASTKKVSSKIAVVVALLKRDDLRADQLAGALQTVESLAHWSQQTNHGIYLGRLLAAVLGSPRVDASYRAGATRRALEWLDSYGTHPGASNVLAVLLDRLDLAPEDGETVAAHAEAWLAAVDSETWGRLSVEEALCRYRERQGAPAPPSS
ncbi:MULTISPECIES: trypsin-like serine protease [Streptomyces]